MTLFFLLCKCTSICRLRPTLSNFIRCQIMTAATKKQSRKTRCIIHIHIHIYVHIYVHIFVLFYLKFDFQWMLGLEHFMNFYEPLQSPISFLPSKTKKESFLSLSRLPSITHQWSNTSFLSYMYISSH